MRTNPGVIIVNSDNFVTIKDEKKRYVYFNRSSQKLLESTQPIKGYRQKGQNSAKKLFDQKYQPPIEKIPALLMRTCKGAERAFHASANLVTESNERRSTCITLISQKEMSMTRSNPKT